MPYHQNLECDIIIVGKGVVITAVTILLSFVTLLSQLCYQLSMEAFNLIVYKNKEKTHYPWVMGCTL